MYKFIQSSFSPKLLKEKEERKKKKKFVGGGWSATDCVIWSSTLEFVFMYLYMYNTKKYQAVG